MFGYVTPDKPYLLMKDYALYKCVYCGICKSIAKNYGTLPRFTTNYDSVFLSLLLHNYLDSDYNIERQTCILHPLKKRGVALDDELTLKVVTVNILLSYHKLTDDIIDGSRFFKRAARFSLVKKAYKKAKKLMPEAEKIISEEYENLRRLEKIGEKSIDMAAHPFSSMMERLCVVLLGEKTNPSMEQLFYKIGKWIYLTDALDDLEKDKKSGNFNPIIAAFGDFTDVAAYKAQINERMRFIFNCISRGINEDFANLQFKFNTDILRNILFRGIINTTNTLMENTKCKKIRI